MRLLTRAAFAGLAQVSRAAITKAVHEHRLEIIEGGKTGRIDADCYKSVQYLKLSNEQRDKGAIKTPSSKKKRPPVKSRQTKQKPPAVKKAIVFPGAETTADHEDKQRGKIIVLPMTGAGSPAGPKPAGEPPEMTEQEKEYARQMETIEGLAERYNAAKTGKIEQQEQALKLTNARIRGELVDREKVYNNLFMYLDKLHSNLERLADSFLSDIGPLMVDAGKVMPEHRESWKDEVLSQIDESKTGMVKMLSKIEKEQSK